MSLLKRVSILSFATAAILAGCLCLAGCGNDAATWNGGSVSEDTVTSTIENLRSYYELTDDADWAEFVKERTYEEASTASLTATEKAIDNVTPKDDDAQEPDGTAEDLRTYIIEQIIRSQIIQNEIDSRNITVTDEEVDAYVEQQRSYVESRLMEGVFESVLQRQGYANLDAYKDEIREQLKQLKLQNEVSTVTTDEGTAISGKTAWNIWFDEAYANANVKINAGPNPLPYEIVDVSSDESEGDEAPAGEGEETE